MASKLPKFVVLQAVLDYGEAFMYYDDRPGVAQGPIQEWGKSVFNPLSKIEIEPSRVNPNDLVHLRFVHTNKYWSVIEGYPNILSIPDKPDESNTSPTCTLFRPQVNGNKLYLFHVYSNKPVTRTSHGLNIDTGGAQLSDMHAFYWVDIEDLVQLPKMVAFKGIYNNKYLKSVTLKGYPHLQFSGDDPNKKETAHGVEVMENGLIQIKSLYFEKYWRLSPSWIWADTTDTNDRNAWFKPIKVGDKIVLQNVGNGFFCRSLTLDGKDDCLNANVDTMTNETKLEVEDLVSERSLYNVRFRTEYSRVYDETPYVMGETTAVNESEHQSQVQVKLSKVEKVSHTFTTSVSITLGFKITVNIGPEAAKLGSTEISGSITGTHTVGNATEDSTTVECIATVPVPKKSKAVCKIVGTKGKTNIPFSYTRQDKSSYDGKVTKEDHIDGIYSGVAYYGFHVVVRETQPL